MEATPMTELGKSFVVMVLMAVLVVALLLTPKLMLSTAVLLAILILVTVKVAFTLATIRDTWLQRLGESDVE